jgi:hypothetical protein
VLLIERGKNSLSSRYKHGVGYDKKWLGEVVEDGHYFRTMRRL